MGSRDVDPYLDTLYSAFELISSGVTTVQHICDTVEGSVEEVKRRLDRIIEAYQDVGMRASVCYGLADQNHLVHEANSTFLARLPNEISVPLAKVLEAIQTGLEGGLEIFAQLHSEYSSNRRLRVQLAPANLHWCSDRALSMIADVAQRYRAQLHMHLLETPYQRAYSNRRNPAGALAHLRDFGLLTPSLTLGHGVWLNDFEIGLLSDAGCSICINCSSNLRLSSGLARLKKLEASGINTAIGIDEAGLNDDRDMLLEMRIVHSLNNDPGLESLGPTSCQILRMATVGGALTTGFSDKVGALEVGRAADIVLFDREALTEPHVDERQPVADLILRRAKPGHVRSVICGGRIIYEDGRFSEVDREQILTELRSQLSQDLSEGERMKRDLSRALLPHVRRQFCSKLSPS